MGFVVSGSISFIVPKQYWTASNTHFEAFLLHLCIRVCEKRARRSGFWDSRAGQRFGSQCWIQGHTVRSHITRSIAVDTEHSRSRSVNN